VAIALDVAAFRTDSRSPDNESSIVWLTGPSIATHTAPTGWPSNGLGPATPVVPIAHVVPKDLIAPLAITDD
jgi:hypothetical protein